MAEAYKSVKEIQPAPVLEDRITLELTPDEAATLARVCQLIGGDPSDSPRRHMEAINAALRGAGVRAVDHCVMASNGAIYFKTYPKSADEPFRVGDRVRIVEAAFTSRKNGAVGYICDLDLPDKNAPYRVDVGNDERHWARRVERVGD